MTYPVADFIGVLLMIIPAFIAATWGKSISEGRIFKHVTHYSIQPSAVTGLFGLIVIAAYVVRYGFFKKETILDVIISIARLALDAFVLAAILEMFLQSGEMFRCELLIFGGVMTWLGMKSIAGYSLILVILLNISGIGTLNSLMGIKGAIFFIFAGISFLLQLYNTGNIKDFWKDLISDSSSFSRLVKDDINAAIQDSENVANSLNVK